MPSPSDQHPIRHSRPLIPHFIRKNTSLTSPQADDEIGDAPYLAGFEWDPEECYTRFIVHQKKEGAPAPSKKKKKGGDE